MSSVKLVLYIKRNLILIYLIKWITINLCSLMCINDWHINIKISCFLFMDFMNKFINNRIFIRWNNHKIKKKYACIEHIEYYFIIVILIQLIIIFFFLWPTINRIYPVIVSVEFLVMIITRIIAWWDQFFIMCNRQSQIFPSRVNRFLVFRILIGRENHHDRE